MRALSTNATLATSKAMRSLLVLALCWLSLTGLESHARQTELPIARVFGNEIRCSELQAYEPRACATALLRQVQTQVIRAFVEHNALNATPGEVNRIIEYNRAFEQHDRLERERKLAELDTRLASESLTPDERKQLEGFRAVLARLAAYDADVDAGIEVRDPVDLAVFRGWVESAKANALLYARYGGSVGVMAHGPYAHGALTKLVAEYVECGSIEILDTGVARLFQEALHAPPRIMHPQGEPDFTPFWERPMVPSYTAH